MQTVPNHLDNFDRGQGTGSGNQRDDWLDESSIYHNEWGSTAATTFNPKGRDAQGRRLTQEKIEKFEELYKLHNGQGEQTRRSSIRQSHIINDAKMFTSALEMPEPQRERVFTILQNLDISSNNFGGRRYEKIILALCSLVADEALTERYNGSNNPISVDDRLFLTDDFRHLMTTIGMSNRELNKIRTQIRQKSDQF